MADSHVSDDTEFNPLLDAEESEGDESERSAEDGTERYLELRQALIHQRDEIDNLKESVASLEETIERRNQEVDILRNATRRLRFQADTQGAQRRRNQTFFDATRRKFLEGWNGDMAVINSADLDHLAFLSHILDLPPFGEDEVRT